MDATDSKVNLGNLLLLILAVVFVANFAAKKADLGEDMQQSQYASQVMPRLVVLSAAAYKQALEQLKDSDTEQSFNANLSKLQRAATDLAYKPLDTQLQEAFNPPGSDKSTWTPAKAREVYSKVLDDLLTLQAKLNRAGLVPKDIK
jgi:ribosome-binding ATPase YchF (GTP1/OBG family)